jgi:phosphoribulokinase
MVLEGLHPFYDERVRALYDFKIYLDISDEVKFAWKIQRDMKERGHSLESIKASIEARKPDFDAYIDPQKQHADVIIQVSNVPLAWQQAGHASVPFSLCQFLIKDAAI